MKIEGRRILIAGSADPQSPENNLTYAHTLVSELTQALAQRGANFIVTFGSDPKLTNRVDGPSIIFDWTVGEILRKALDAGQARPSGIPGRLITAVGTQKTFEKIPQNRLETYTALRSAKSMNVVFIEPGWGSGAVRRARQAQLGDILIGISGGEGVEHLAQEFAHRGKHVIPLDLDLGASCTDGSGGAARLFGEALHAPNLFFRVASDQSGTELLDRTRTRNGVVPHNQVADAIIDLLERLVPPHVFYVRLLNKDLPDYPSVEDFFRNIIDPTVTDLGFEPLQMGIGPNEYAWMNQAIFDSLHHSEVALVDLTGVRPNCFMELGYALGNTQRVIVTARKGTEVPFDPSCLETYLWDPTETVAKSRQDFREHWTRNINMPPLVRPRGLG
jgi:hypothetical protein